MRSTTICLVNSTLRIALIPNKSSGNASKKIISFQFGLSFCLTQRSLQLGLNLIIYFLLRLLSSNKTRKLTITPRKTKIIVFNISLEIILGTILNKIPKLVPDFKVRLNSIASRFWNYFMFCHHQN